MFISLVLGEGFGSFLHETFPPGQEGNQFFGFRGNITRFSVQTIGRLSLINFFAAKTHSVGHYLLLKIRKISDSPTGRNSVTLAQYNFFS